MILMFASVPNACLAQAPALDSTQTPAATDAEKAKPSKDSSDWIEARIAKLHRKLHITPEQESAWNDYAMGMRDTAKSMQPLYIKYYNHQNTMTAIENMQLYMEMAEGHAKSQRVLIPLFEKVYNMMTYGQKQIADEIFSDQAKPKQRKK
jgi:hypothetical protein